MPVRLVIGLGNPGPKYEKTRHNVGFMLLDRVAERFRGAVWSKWGALGETLEGEVDGRAVILARPLTYMNESGRMAGDLARFRKIPPGDVLVCYDDFALPLPKLRIRLKGSAGGHNGMQSIIDHLGTQEVPRLRVGIGPVPAGRDPADFVLSRFRPDERKGLESALDDAVSAIATAADAGVEAAMNRFNAPEAGKA